MVLRKKSVVKLAFIGLLPLGLALSACGNSSMDAADVAAESSTDTVLCEESASAETCEAPPTAGPGGHGEGHAMDLGPADATYDLRFIDGMIIHHEGAVVMAEAALANSERAEIRQLAEAIISAQKAEIAQMQEWRKTWYPEVGSEPMMYHADMGHDMGMSDEMAAAMRMDIDLGSADDEFDLRFINAMIPHHEGALVMAEDLKAKSTRPEMQALAEEIIAAQQTEIEQMQEWRKAWYNQ